MTRSAISSSGAAERERTMPTTTLRLLLLLLLVMAAAVRGADISETTPELGAATPAAGRGKVELGEACEQATDCRAEGAECGDSSRCSCPFGHIVDALGNHCGLPAKINESCIFHEQCLASTVGAECAEGFCACPADMAPINIGNGNGDNNNNNQQQCVVAHRVKLGEKCREKVECTSVHAYCDPVKNVCTCMPDYPVTNNVDKCGKAVTFNGTCEFNEQCANSTAKTVCRNSICTCMYQMKAEGEGSSLHCVGGELKYGDRCMNDSQCGFDHGFCDRAASKPTCLCLEEYRVTNHINMCGKPAHLNETCVFKEQCENTTPKTECRDGRCGCIFQMDIVSIGGVLSCVDVKPETPSTQYIDPTMIGVLVGMVLMFIILCVVLRLFSKARWRENRTIFNTPNPRLMNVSLLRDSKLLHSGEQRRGSRASVRGPSRQPSMASLRPTSPSASLGGGSRRGSRGSSNASATSTRSPRSPSKPLATPNNIDSPPPNLENVTVEVQDPSANK